MYCDRVPSPFQRVYICLKACKEGFVVGCRHIIGDDRAHLRRSYLRILLTAVAKDGNPIACAVIETERGDTWTRFLALFIDNINAMTDEETKITFMSNKQKVSTFLLPYKIIYMIIETYIMIDMQRLVS